MHFVTVVCREGMQSFAAFINTNAFICKSMCI